MRANQNWQATVSGALLKGEPVSEPGSDSVRAPVMTERQKGWLGRLFERLEEKRLARERSEMEAYLADATDIADLEQRMRRWDRGLVPRNTYGGFGF